LRTRTCGEQGGDHLSRALGLRSEKGDPMWNLKNILSRGNSEKTSVEAAGTRGWGNRPGS